MTLAQAPAPSEYNAYYHEYVSLVPAGDALAFLEQQAQAAAELLEGVSEADSNRAYAEGKWTLKQVLAHVIDIEWVFTYRSMRIARGDSTALPGVDQDQLIAGFDPQSRTLADMRAEFQSLRAANLRLFRSLPAQALDRQTEASGFPISARAMIYVLAGHAEHHLRVLRERYL